MTACLVEHSVAHEDEYRFDSEESDRHHSVGVALDVNIYTFRVGKGVNTCGIRFIAVSSGRLYGCWISTCEGGCFCGGGGDGGAPVTVNKAPLVAVLGTSKYCY